MRDTCPTCHQDLPTENALTLKNHLGTSIADNIDADGDCWQWTGTRTREGYGSYNFKGRRYTAHRIIWETLIGPIPDGLEIDHLCRNRLCCNPDHLEPVTHTENVRRGAGNQNTRKTHCNRGHELSGDNLYMHNGKRWCRTCRRNYMQKRRNLGLSPTWGVYTDQTGQPGTAKVPA